MNENAAASNCLRTPGLLFVLSLGGFIVLMTITIGMVLPSFPKGINGLTPQQMASFQSIYVLSQAFVIVPVILSAIATAMLYTALKETSARGLAMVALVFAVIMCLLYLMLVAFRVSLVGFTDTTLAENATWQWTSWAYDKPAIILPAFATFFIGVSLYRSHLLRRTGLIVAILSGVLILLAVFMGFAPFVFGFLWLVIGIGLLRHV